MKDMKSSSYGRRLDYERGTTSLMHSIVEMQIRDFHRTRGLQERRSLQAKGRLMPETRDLSKLLPRDMQMHCIGSA